MQIDYKKAIDTLTNLLGEFMVGDLSEEEKKKHISYRFADSYRRMIRDIIEGRYDDDTIRLSYKDHMISLKKTYQYAYVPEEITSQ